MNSLTLMSFFLLWLTVTNCVVVVPKRLTAVYTSVDIENVYRQFRKVLSQQLVPKGKPAKSKSTPANVMKEACRDIFSSSYFNDMKREPVDVSDMKIQNELEEKYGALFKKLFRKSRLSGIYRMMKKNEYKYANTYTPRTVAIAGNPPFEDHVFSCPVRDQTSRKIIEYLVSKEYNFQIKDTNVKISSNYDGARFVFLEDAALDNNMVKIQAVAEPPARFLSLAPNLLVSHFLDDTKTDGASTRKKQKKNSICVLPDLERLRLCTLIMNPLEDRKKIKFLPRSDFVGDACEKKEINIEDQKPEEKSAREIMTISCTGKDVDKKQNVKYYITGGPNDGQVFVLHENSNKKLILDEEAVIPFTF